MVVVRRSADTLVVVGDDSELANEVNEDLRTQIDGEVIRCTDSEGRLWIKSDEWMCIE